MYQTFITLLCLLSLSSCANINTLLVKNVAQPDNRPVRNFTSFSASLRCMDKLLANAHVPKTYISSTGFSDLSKKINVGADEMLVNAVNQTNIKSRAFLFLDQSFEKDFGQLEFLTKTDDRKLPKLYIRGAITQVDTNTINDSLKVSVDFTNAPNPPTINGGALQTLSPNLSKGVSIVSVDMHLVSFPDKVVMPGMSVANAMVVTNKSIGTGAVGLIKLTGYDMTLSFNRVESIGQAVRNLIELGTIELLGQHAKVPYWQCLNIEPTNEKLENKKHKKFIASSNQHSILETQKMLAGLGYYAYQPNGRMNIETHAALAKYQADKDLIATGDLNYDVYTRLVQEFKGYPVNGPVRTIKHNATTQNARLRKKSKPRLFARQSLLLSSPNRPYRLNDKLVVNLTANKAGILYCFHQPGDGGITQILPIARNVQLQIPANYTRQLPNAQDGFTLKFETTNKSESIMCVLQNNTANAKSPFNGKFKPFDTLPVKRLEDIPAQFSNFGGLKDWVMITEIVKP